MMIVDNAIYVDGHRASEPRSLRETYEALRKERGVAWIGLYRPTEEEFGGITTADTAERAPQPVPRHAHRLHGVCRGRLRG
jgi:hypothetical protein